MKLNIVWRLQVLFAASTWLFTFPAIAQQPEILTSADIVAGAQKRYKPAICMRRESGRTLVKAPLDCQRKFIAISDSVSAKWRVPTPWKDVAISTSIRSTFFAGTRAN